MMLREFCSSDGRAIDVPKLPEVIGCHKRESDGRGVRTVPPGTSTTDHTDSTDGVLKFELCVAVSLSSVVHSFVRAAHVYFVFPIFTAFPTVFSQTGGPVTCPCRSRESASSIGPSGSRARYARPCSGTSARM